jgi:hypothetical protein
LTAFSSVRSEAVAATVSSQLDLPVTSYYRSVLQSTLHVIWAAQHKKGAGAALTSQAGLAHNPKVREYVLDETVLFQPMTSGRRPLGFRSAT